MAELSSESLHATTVAVDGIAVALEGPSGVGKSDLALRLIDRGAVLISDDYTLMVRCGERLMARAPQRMAGRIEVRGVGLIALPFIEEAPVGLIVRVGQSPERLPERRERRVAGIAVREIATDAFHASAAIKIEHALRQPEATPV